MKDKIVSIKISKRQRIIDPSVSEMFFYDKLYKEPGKGISRSAYAGKLLAILKRFEEEVKQLSNLSKFISKSYFKRVKSEIWNYTQGSPIYRNKPPAFGPTTYYLYLLYRGNKQILKRVEYCLSRLKNYITNATQKKEFKEIGKSLLSPDINKFRSYLFELFMLGEFVKKEVLVEPFYQKDNKIYDALIKIDKKGRIVEITSLQESKHDLKDQIGSCSVPLMIDQVVRRIRHKIIRGHKPDIFILSLGDFADDVSGEWGINKLIDEDKCKSHILLIYNYLSLNGKFYISPSPYGSPLSAKEQTFFRTFLQ